MIQAERSRVRFLMRSLNVSIDLILAVALRPWGSIQPLKVMSTRNLPGGKGLPARRADVTAICELIAKKMWESGCLTTLWASTAC
jgi:hypothetical protein